MDILRLILRCLILITLAFLLAGPIYNRKNSEESLKGWILIEEEYLEKGYAEFKTEIDSLINVGYQTRYFNTGFKNFDLADTKKTQIDSSRTIHEVSYWSLVKALDDTLPGNAKAFIYSANYQNRLEGVRPKIISKINWKTFNPADSIFNKIEAAYLTTSDSLRLLLGRYEAGETTFSFENTSIANLNPAYELTGNNELRIKQIKSFERSIDSSTVSIDTSTIKIALFADQYKADLAYLKAALEAIKSVSQRKMVITTYNNADQIPAETNWLFWLSERKIPTEKKALNTFAYQAGKTVNTNHSLIVSKNSSPDFEQKYLHKRKVFWEENVTAETLWEDEIGNPILTLSVGDSTNHLRFFSHFDPEWNDLPWNARFPELLLSIMSHDQFNNKQAGKIWDRRIIADQQILPVSLKSIPNKSAEATIKQTNLERYFWLFLIFLFGLERLLSVKRKPANA